MFASKLGPSEREVYKKKLAQYHKDKLKYEKGLGKDKKSQINDATRALEHNAKYNIKNSPDDATVLPTTDPTAEGGVRLSDTPVKSRKPTPDAFDTSLTRENAPDPASEQQEDSTQNIIRNHHLKKFHVAHARMTRANMEDVPALEKEAKEHAHQARIFGAEDEHFANPGELFPKNEPLTPESPFYTPPAPEPKHVPETHKERAERQARESFTRLTQHNEARRARKDTEKITSHTRKVNTALQQGHTKDVNSVKSHNEKAMKEHEKAKKIHEKSTKKNAKGKGEKAEFIDSPAEPNLKQLPEIPPVVTHVVPPSIAARSKIDAIRNKGLGIVPDNAPSKHWEPGELKPTGAKPPPLPGPIKEPTELSHDDFSEVPSAPTMEHHIGEYNKAKKNFMTPGTDLNTSLGHWEDMNTHESAARKLGATDSHLGKTPPPPKPNPAGVVDFPKKIKKSEIGLLDNYFKKMEK
jgi:hypothetical protein